jgi:hypothetical protein
MSGLREAFDQIVADVPVYGDLEEAIEQVARERRHRYGAVVGLAAAAAALVVIAGIVAVSRATDAAPPVSPSPTPSPTAVKSQSPQTGLTPRSTRRTGPDGMSRTPWTRLGRRGSRSRPITSTRRESISTLETGGAAPPSTCSPGGTRVPCTPSADASG